MEHYTTQVESITQMMKLLSGNPLLKAQDGTPKDKMGCNMCHSVIDLVDNVISNGVVDAIIETLLINKCNDFVDRTICAGFVRGLGDVVIANAVAFELSSAFLCENVFTFCDPTSYVLQDEFEFINRVLADKPQDVVADDFIDKLYVQIEAAATPRKTIKMLQFTDLHLDLDYVTGTAKRCSEILCCRAYDNEPVDPSNQAS